jgi:hypothetical protein
MFYLQPLVLTVRGLNPGGGDIFRIRPDRPWGPPSLLYNGHRVSFPKVKRLGRGVNHPLPSSAEVKERVELYRYSPSEPLVLEINEMHSGQQGSEEQNFSYTSVLGSFSPLG